MVAKFRESHGLVVPAKTPHRILSTAAAAALSSNNFQARYVSPPSRRLSGPAHCHALHGKMIEFHD